MRNVNPLTFHGWSEPTRALFVSLNTKVVPNKLTTELNAVTQALCSDHLSEHKKHVINETAALKCKERWIEYHSMPYQRKKSHKVKFVMFSNGIYLQETIKIFLYV